MLTYKIPINLSIGATPPTCSSRASKAQETNLPSLKHTSEIEGRIRTACTPERIGATVDAVRQWRYKLMLINGNLTDVETETTINFKFDVR